MIDHICDNCGNSFLYAKSELYDGDHRCMHFCSPKCFDNKLKELDREVVRKKALEVKQHLDDFMKVELNRPPTPNEFQGIT